MRTPKVTCERRSLPRGAIHYGEGASSDWHHLGVLTYANRSPTHAGRAIPRHSSNFIGDVGVASSGLRLADIGGMKLRHSLGSGPIQRNARPQPFCPTPSPPPAASKVSVSFGCFHHMNLWTHDATCLMTPGAMVGQASSMNNFSLAKTIFMNHFAVHATRIVRMCPSDLVQKFPSAPSTQRGRPHKYWDQTLASFSCIFFLEKIVDGNQKVWLMAKSRVTFVSQHCGNIGTKNESLKVLHVCRCGFRVVTGCFCPVSCSEDCDSVRRAMRIGGELP